MQTFTSYERTAVNNGLFTPTSLVLIQKGMMNRPIYEASGEATKWDGVNAGFAAYSERHDLFSYFQVRVTGRKMRYSDFGGMFATVQIRFRDGDEWGAWARAEILVMLSSPVETIADLGNYMDF